MGKSTLMLQCIYDLGQKGVDTLYCSAEESLRQISMRARRLGLGAKGMMAMATSSLEEVMKEMEALSPRVAVIDSIQALFTQGVSSAPGSVTQVREVVMRLTQMAKAQGMALFLIGHVTKEGAIAGPKAVEHIVDVVLYLEHRGDSPYRILRAVKNRFGSTNEVGVFEMGEGGLREVPNPSEIFLAERPKDVPGSVVMPGMEGTRPILVEIQALVAPALGIPRRTAMGYDYHRLLLLVGVLEKRMGVNLSQQDCLVNVVGGLKVEEPAGDLAAIGALLSSHWDRPFPADMVAFGEVGLTGEVRSVGYGGERIAEASRLGFRRALVPKGTARSLKEGGGMRIIGIEHIREITRVWEDKG